MLKFAKWLVALGAVMYVGTVAIKRYLAKHNAERVEAVQALNLRDNITVAELKDHLGDGVRTNDGVAWNTDGLRVYSVKAEDNSQPYIIQIQKNYQGRILGRTFDDYGRLLAATRKPGPPWMVLRQQGDTRSWYVSYAFGAADKLLSVSLMRMTTVFTEEQRWNCPAQYLQFVRSSRLALDVN